MEKEPEGNYGLTFALVKNCSKEEFTPEKLNQHEYEVIGGLHNMTAAKALNIKYPENVHSMAGTRGFTADLKTKRRCGLHQGITSQQQCVMTCHLLKR